jgi:hypothetical protein
VSVNRVFDNSFEALSGGLPATVGVAVAAAGGVGTTSFGSWSTGVAWSTIKVPLVIAALRAGSDSRELVAATITQSDNAAAEQLWCELGNPDEAARQVQAVIRDGGDTTTVVESRRLRADYTAFGQTQWSLVRQARFAAGLPSIPDASPVVDLMGNLAPDHRWGLAAKGFAAKAGWGPGMNGGYLVRQFAILPAESGTTGLALAADAHDGVFETGVDVLNTLSDWVIENLAELTHD